MAYVSRSRRPSASISVRSDLHDNDDGTNASAASYVLTNDRNEYSDDHIKILYDIVVRAEELLPTLPESYRRPIPALLKAYNEVLPEYGIHPEDDHQITKLVFKVGGVFGRGSLMDKFRAALSRMNITLELDVPQLHPGGTGDGYIDDAYSISDDASLAHGAPNHPASGEEGDDEYPGTDNGRDYYSNGGETSDDYTIPKDELGSQLDENDSYTIPRSEHDIPYDDPVGKVHDAAREAHLAQSRIEQNLEQSAIAFHDRYRARFSIMAAFREWQRYSQSLTHRWNQYQEALESDMVGVVEDTFHAWRTVSAEAQEVLPPYLPSNIYSKRTEQIAARTYQIFAVKNAFSRWRRRSRERGRSRRQQPQEKEKAGQEPLDPLERVAIKAHENLALSRAFVRWSNRSAQEAKKSRVAAKIYEMGLKSKAFGSRRRPDDTLFSDPTPPGGEEEAPELATEEPALAEEDDELFYGDSRSAEMQQKAEMARKLFLMRSLAKRASDVERPGHEHVEETTADDEDGRLQETQQSVQLTQQLSSIKALAARKKESVHQIGALKPGKDKVASMECSAEKSASGGLVENSDEKIEDELDERTLLARRHILRMRYFSAWESYATNHVTKVRAFAAGKIIDPWRERVVEMHDTERRYTENHQDRHLRSTVHTWAQEANQSEDLEDKAEKVGQRLRIAYVLKPWIAASRQKQKLSEKKGWAFNVWFDHEDNDAILAVMADQQYFSQRSSQILEQWQAAKDERSARRTVFKTYSDRALYYYNVTGALRAWKAAAREAAIQKSMKTEALEMWQKAWQDELPRQEEMKSRAEEANLAYGAAKTLPVWRAETQRAAEIQKQQQNYADRADYYYKTKGTLLAWRVLAAAQHKNNIKKAHSEARRRIKKAMGEHCIAQWRGKLQPSFERFEAMNTNLEEVIINREWQQTEQAFDTWRGRAHEQTQMQPASSARAKQKTLDRWREAAADHQQLRADAAEHWRGKAASRALRGWSLGSLQKAGRAHTVANFRDKRDRRLLRQGLEGWHGRAARKLEVAAAAIAAADGPPDGPAERARHEAAQDQARGLLHTWQQQAAAGGRGGRGGGPDTNNHKGTANANVNAASVPLPLPAEDEVYVPTPGRPRLPIFGSLGHAASVSTTPLAPVPSRASWHPAGGAGRSSLMRGGTGPGPGLGLGASARASRSKRNLRVSWAD